MVRWAFGAVGLGVAVVGPAQEIVVESRPGGKGFEGYKEVAGHWISSNTPPERVKSSAPGLSPPALGSGKVEETTKPAVVRFSPMLSAPGRYAAAVTWSEAGNVKPVVIRVRHAGGEEQKVMAQDGWNPVRPNGNVWIDLGEYEFGPGPDQYVELSITGTDTATAAPGRRPQFYADSVRFTPAGGGGSSAPSAAGNGAGSAVSGQPARPPAGGPAWHATLTDAQTAAGRSGKPVLVFFSARGGGDSEFYERVFASDPAVRERLQGFECARLELAEHLEAGSRLGVYRGGVVVILAPNGTVSRRLERHRTPEAVMRELQ